MKAIKKVIPLISGLFLILATVFSMSGCKFKINDYQGEYPELYTVAINSILATRGYSGGGSEPASSDPEIKLMGEDSHGRRLFQYFERGTTYDGFNGFVGLIILQKHDDSFVYYYPDDCFILQQPETDNEDTSLLPYYPLKPFPNEKIESLKIKNDWNKEINENKCVKIAIARKRQEPNVKIKDEVFEKIFLKTANDAGYKSDGSLFSRSVYLTSDSDGRMLYYAYGTGQSSNGKATSETRKFYLMIIFNSDGSYDLNKCAKELNDLYNYQDDLKAFKELNKWSHKSV